MTSFCEISVAVDRVGRAFTDSSIGGVFAGQISVAVHVLEGDLKERVVFKLGSHIGITQSDRIT